jgi:DNA-binding GntR family transcriptional regulator
MFAGNKVICDWRETGRALKNRIAQCARSPEIWREDCQEAAREHRRLMTALIERQERQCRQGGAS